MWGASFWVPTFFFTFPALLFAFSKRLPTNGPQALAKEVVRLSAALQKLEDHQAISDLFSRYGWLHDKLMVGQKPTAAQAAQFEVDVLEWENRSTEDVKAVFTLTRTVGNNSFGDVFRRIVCFFPGSVVVTYTACPAQRPSPGVGIRNRAMARHQLFHHEPDS